MDFREFSKAYNDYLCHAAPSGHTTGKGDKKSYISTADPNEPPKHYAYKLAKSGWTLEDVRSFCERSSNAYDSPANHKYWSEVLRIFKENYIQHSYSDDYLIHGNDGMPLQERLSALKSVLKKNRNNVPSQKIPRYDALTQIVVEQTQNGNIQQAQQTARELSSLSGSPSSMLLQYIAMQFEKKDEFRPTGNPKPITGHRK